MLQYSKNKNCKSAITYKREFGVEKGNSNIGFYELVTLAIAISQTTFWFASIFLSLVPFSFLLSSTSLQLSMKEYLSL